MSDTKRRMLTPEERVAKLEAELKAAREKAEAKNAKRIGELVEQRNKLKAQIDDRQVKVDAINSELDSLGYTFEVEAEDDNVVSMPAAAEG